MTNLVSIVGLGAHEVFAQRSDFISRPSLVTAKCIKHTLRLHHHKAPQRSPQFSITMQHQNGHSTHMIDATANQVNGSGNLGEAGGAQWGGDSLLEAMKENSNEVMEMDIQEDLNEEHAIERMTAPELRAYIDRQVDMRVQGRLFALEDRLHHHIAV
jgi:hypothetical protein